MTETEKIAYAKSFIDKLAEGINPLDGTPVPEGDLVNNVRISRCFYYVSDILRRICEKGGVDMARRPTARTPFTLTEEIAENEVLSENPVTISVFARRMRYVADEYNMRRIPIHAIVNWLLTIEALTFVTHEDGKRAKVPTEKGMELGIILKRRMASFGEYDQVQYTIEAQRFIIDNLSAFATY